MILYISVMTVGMAPFVSISYLSYFLLRVYCFLFSVFKTISSRVVPIELTEFKRKVGWKSGRWNVEVGGEEVKGRLDCNTL